MKTAVTHVVTTLRRLGLDTMPRIPGTLWIIKRPGYQFNDVTLRTTAHCALVWKSEGLIRSRTVVLLSFSIGGKIKLLYTSCCLFGQQPPMGHGLLIHEVSRSHTTTHHSSVGLLWTSDQLVAEISTWHHTTLTTDKHPCPRWDSNPQSQQVSGPQTYALERAATGTGNLHQLCN